MGKRLSDHRNRLSDCKDAQFCISLYLPKHPPKFPYLLSPFPPSLIPFPGARYFTKVLYLSVLCWHFLLFLIYWLVYPICAETKGNGMFDHMCYS